MDFLGWMALIGGLLLIMALSTAVLRRLPITTSLIYLMCGVVIGPFGLHWLHVDLLKQAEWFERLTEIAVIVSLFVGGLKIRLSPREPEWRAAFVLAGPLMLVSIGAVAAFTHFTFGISPPLALLLGAVLAPTDPVLASSVSVNDAADHDRLRYALSVEAGLNDGAAFPFVIFGLLWLKSDAVNDWIGSWALERVLWAIPAGLLIGYGLGYVAGRFTIYLRSRDRDAGAPNDFLALALIALSYVIAESVHAWGFLAVFAAGVGVRSAELQVVGESPHPDVEQEELDASDEPHPPAEDMVSAKVTSEDMKQPAVAAGVVIHEVLSFGKTLERLLEVMLVVLVGIAVSTHWDTRAVVVAIALFVIIRPLASWLLLALTPTAGLQRWLMGWFGIRGIGSLYYLTYALNHGSLERDDAQALAGLTVSVVALSILLHGATAQPFLDRYEKWLKRQEAATER